MADAGTGDPVLAAEGIWWRHRRRPWLLEDVSVTLRPGELLRVRGANGSGKSTLLRVLAGCTVPHRGVVRLGVRAAYLPQLARSLPRVPAGRLAALLAGERREGLLPPEHIGTPADTLSSGTARRLLLDVVLALPSRLLVLDEPAAGLDTAATGQLAEVLRARLAGGSAVVLADHGPLPLTADRVLTLGGRAAEPAQVAITLGGSGAFRGRTADGGRLLLTVPVHQRDALLLAALREGWAVLAVEGTG